MLILYIPQDDGITKALGGRFFMGIGHAPEIARALGVQGVQVLVPLVPDLPGLGSHGAGHLPSPEEPHLPHFVPVENLDPPALALPELLLEEL